MSSVPPTFRPDVVWRVPWTRPLTSSTQCETLRDRCRYIGGEAHGHRQGVQQGVCELLHVSLLGQISTAARSSTAQPPFRQFNVNPCNLCVATQPHSTRSNSALALLSTENVIPKTIPLGRHSQHVPQHDQRSGLLGSWDTCTQGRCAYLQKVAED